MIKNPSTFNFLSGTSGNGHRRRAYWNIKSNVDALDASTTSTKFAASAIKRIQFSKEAFNMVVQFIHPLKEYPDSNERKCLIMLGNLEKTPITAKAAEYVERDPENPNSIHLIPKYTEAAKTLWKDLETERPLSEEDFIDLRTHGCYYISLPTSLVNSCSPGDFVQLYDVLFTVHVKRDQYKNLNKLSDLTEAQREWKGKMATKRVEGTGVELEYEVKPMKPSFKFKAKFGHKLSTVSVGSLVKVYKEQQFLSYYIENPMQRLVKHGGGRSIVYGDDYDEDVFRMRKEWYEPKNIVCIVYDAMYDGSVPTNPIFAPDGKAYVFEVLSYPNEYISDNDFKADEVKFDCAKSRTEVDKKNKAWCFMIRASQRVWTKAPNPEEYADTDGYDTDHPTEDTIFSAKINVYKEVIERDFGIVSDALWTRFISCYHKYFRGVFQCLINWKKTENRMDRLIGFAGTAGEHDDNGDGGGASRPFDFTVDYSCNSVLFSMREMIQRFGIPVDKKTANQLLDNLVEVRRRPDATKMRGSVSDVTELATKSKHSIVCLNELKSMDTAKAYLAERFNRAYVVLLPESSNLGVEMFKVIESITEEREGTALLRALHFGDPLNKSNYGDELSSVFNSLKMTGYATKALHPLIFAVGDIQEHAYCQEATTIAKFLGISSDMEPELVEWLQGESSGGSGEKPSVSRGEHEEIMESEIIPKEERHVSFDQDKQHQQCQDQEILEMGTQNALVETLGSYEESQEEDTELPEERDQPAESGDKKGGSLPKSSKRKTSTKPKYRPGFRKGVSKRPRTSRRV